MAILLNENLRKLRTERQLTQEQLAETLGVAPQTISRWEIGTVAPDISMLPVIAGYFGISVDELLGVDTARKEEKIKSILKENRIFHNNGETEKSIKLLRSALTDYPNESRLLYNLAQSIFSLYYQSGEVFTQSDKENAAHETVDLLKKALRYADDNFDDGGGCRQLLVFTYIKLGEYDKAKDTALKAPLMPSCREIIVAKTLTGQEAVEKHQENLIYFTLYGAYQSISGIRNNGDYTEEQRLEISLMSEKLLLLIGGENSGFSELYYNALQILRSYIKTENKDKILEYLEKAFQYACDNEERPDKTKYNVLWLCCCQNNSEYRMKHSQKTLYSDLLEFVSKYRLDELFNGDKRFIAVLDKINKYS